MPRPRLHEPDRILDAVESMAVGSGPAAVTIRGVSAAVGISNGALYHTFGSRSGLLGHALLRAGRRFLTVQNTLVDQAMVEAGPQAPAAAVVAAAEAPVVFAEQYPESAELLLTVRRAELVDADLPEQIASQISELDRLLIGLMIQLAVNLWDRKDALAVDTITTCIVDLPTAILLQRKRLGSATARAHLRAAVRAVLDVGPPSEKGKHHGN
ncbi:MAG: TetR/AcrR family transcriptional regulator [Mycobacterium sp.]